MTTETLTPQADTQSVTTEPQTTEPQATPVATEPTAPKKEEPVVQDRMTSRLARLAKEEARLAQKEAELVELKKQIDDSSLSVKEKIELLDNLPTRIQENPDEVLQKLGISFEQLTRSILESSDPTAKELRTLQSRLKQLESEREEEKKQRQEAELQLKDKEYEATINEYKTNVYKHIDENPEKYELIKSTGMHDEVWNVITRHFDETKELLTHKQACEFVESYLEESQLKKFAGTKKFSRLIEGTRSSGDKTLSSNVASSNVNTIEKPLSDEERFEKALSIFKNRKK